MKTRTMKMPMTSRQQRSNRKPVFCRLSALGAFMVMGSRIHIWFSSMRHTRQTRFKIGLSNEAFKPEMGMSFKFFLKIHSRPSDQCSYIRHIRALCSTVLWTHRSHFSIATTGHRKSGRLADCPSALIRTALHITCSRHPRFFRPTIMPYSSTPRRHSRRSARRLPRH